MPCGAISSRADRAEAGQKGTVRRAARQVSPQSGGLSGRTGFCGLFSAVFVPSMPRLPAGTNKSRAVPG